MMLSSRYICAALLLLLSSPHITLAQVSAPCGPESPNIVYNAVPPGYAPPDWKAPTCPYFVLDFNELVAGTYVRDQYLTSHGVKITAIKAGTMGYTPVNGVHNNAGGAAMVFDTFRPTGKAGQKLCGTNDGDSDLGAPNKMCVGGGPGEGVGGVPLLNGMPNPYRNCEKLGNVLVIQESKKTCPDDSATGGSINFDFKTPVKITLAKLLDVDEGNTPEITVTYADGKKDMTKVKGTGDNGLIDVVLHKSNVVKVSILYYGSGSIAELVYQVCPNTV